MVPPHGGYDIDMTGCICYGFARRRARWTPSWRAQLSTPRTARGAPVRQREAPEQRGQVGKGDCEELGERGAVPVKGEQSGRLFFLSSDLRLRTKFVGS